jgi:hypothetical protein
MKNIIVCRKWGWLGVALLTLLLIAGIGYLTQIPQAKDDFEKVFMGLFGAMMIFGGFFGLLNLLFGSKKADEIFNWIYGLSMALLGVAFFGSFIVMGILTLFGIKF